MITRAYAFPVIDEEEKQFRAQRLAEYERDNEFFLKNARAKSKTGEIAPPRAINLCFPHELQNPVHEPITTAEEIVLLAHQLLERRDVRDVLEELGQHKDWENKEQEQFVYEVLIQHSKWLRKPGQFADNIEIAIALAKAIAVGAVVGERSELAFAGDRIRTFKWGQTDGELPHPLKLSELLQFFRNLKSNRPDLVRAYSEIAELRKKGVTLKGDDYPSLAGFLTLEQIKYGLANRNAKDLNILEFAVAECVWNRQAGSWCDEDFLDCLRKHKLATFRGKRAFIDDLI